MNGFATMFSVSWRTNRRVLLAWIIGLSAAFVASAWSLHGLYDTPDKLATYAKATAAGSALYAINGRPHGLTTIGGVIAYEFGFMSAIAFPLMGIHLMVRMTRGEERAGRLDLLRAGDIGRSAPAAAALTLVTAAFSVIAGTMVLTLSALHVGWPAAALYPISLAVLGWWFAALTAMGAQCVAAPRMVTGIGLGALVGAFLLRGIGAVRHDGTVWFSPIGWAEQTTPYDGPRWWPLLLAVLTGALFIAAMVRLVARRDVGQGLFASRRGRAHASQAILNPVGLAVRQHRGPIIAWCVVTALVAVSFGALTQGVQSMMSDNDTLQQVFGTGASSADAYLAFTIALLALMCAAFGVQAVGSVADEEGAGRLESLLTGNVSRSRWLRAQVLVIGCGLVVVALVGGLALGVSDAIATTDSGAVGRLLWSTLAYVPAAASVPALGVVAYCGRARYVSAGWMAFIFVAVVATLGDALQLPQWVRDVSPLTWIGRVPGATVELTGVVGAAVLTLVFAALATVAFTRRDVSTGSSGLLHRGRLRVDHAMA
ncbi:hypothetical protein FOS14_07395 [Skermania sp. ID1734]|uniref:ABC transporter permease n=1 Tax=Skermania sp. ID1734 TaxID=2597516 RepID=UPI00117DB662|nr:hypothetical protein [Skermania sp. ID1734]TSE00249.1 hypothetical protein FOS14_07395 [Skermania sp. ID1734]